MANWPWMIGVSPRSPVVLKAPSGDHLETIFRTTRTGAVVTVTAFEQLPPTQVDALVVVRRNGPASAEVATKNRNRIARTPFRIASLR